MKLSPDALQLKAEGYLTTQTHPTLPLTIWNYTPKCQYERHWNDVTMMCRGLVTDSEMNIVARAFNKIFNFEELTEIPDLPYEVFEKLDGSLIIVFWYMGDLVVASRGSFTSPQATSAHKYLQTNYDVYAAIPKDVTLCFELIGSTNRIVLQYDTDIQLILTAGVYIDGSEVTWDELMYALFPVCNKFPREDFATLKSKNTPNQEGYVIRFDNGFRMKIKHPWYVEAHKIATQTSTRTIWEALRQGKPVLDIVSGVPDELYDWVKETAAGLTREFDRRYDHAVQAHEELWTPDRKFYAKKVLAQDKVPSNLLFLLYDNKDITQAIWQSLEPKYERPFQTKQYEDCIHTGVTGIR